MAEFDLHCCARCSTIIDTELDIVVCDSLKEFPKDGYNHTGGLPRAQGHMIQRERIRASMRRVNPEGILLH